MDNTLRYKGYTGFVHFDTDTRCFYGRILGISDVITFQGSSVKDLEKDFYNAVDEYLTTCQKLGKAPEKPFPGRCVLHIPSELHCAIAIAAKKQHKSINSWIADTCKEAIK
jgi:predicted HicB family RNase H-like nuclease